MASFQLVRRGNEVLLFASGLEPGAKVRVAGTSATDSVVFPTLVEVDNGGNLRASLGDFFNSVEYAIGLLDEAGNVVQADVARLAPNPPTNLLGPAGGALLKAAVEVMNDLKWTSNDQAGFIDVLNAACVKMAETKDVEAHQAAVNALEARIRNRPVAVVKSQ